MVEQRLLEIKKELKRRRPEFVRQDSWLRKKLANKPKWRRPKGKHSKMRERRVGKHSRVEVGYRSPVLVRGLTLTGFVPKLVHNLEELQKLNPKTEIAILSSTLGMKSKVEIAKKAQELGIKTNLKQDVLNARLAALKKQREEKISEKKEKEKTKPAAKTGTQTEPAHAVKTESKETQKVEKTKTEKQKRETK